MSWALVVFVKVGPEPRGVTSTAPAPLAVAEPHETIDDGPRVTISLDASGVSAPAEVETPMALPAGYLVPGDGSEESAHAGN